MTPHANLLTKRANVTRQAARSGITVPANDLRALLAAFEKLGYDVEGLLQAAQLRPSDLADPDARLPCEAYPALIGQAQRERFTPNLALRLAAVIPIGAFPLLDYLVVTSDDVGTGVKQLVRYFKLVGSPVVLELRKNVGAIDIVMSGSSLAPFSVEYTVSLTVLHLREESEGRFAATSVSFSHRPDDPVEFERVLGCPIHSRTSWNGITVSPGAWQLPLRRRDPLLRGFLEQQANEAIERLPIQDGEIVEVRRVLVRHIACGESDIAVVARELAISPRTLQRRLAVHGVSYQTLLEDTRKEAAGRHVAESRLAICEIAFLLGYSEPAPFHRAFKRWYGMTPQTFRAQHQTNSGGAGIAGKQNDGNRNSSRSA
jgi:AraC-like DNA-binding protein